MRECVSVRGREWKTERGGRERERKKKRGVEWGE
jgi:hypothetical protein